VITLEDWAEIRRLHRSEKLSQAAIARRLGIARNTVATALKSDAPPRYERRPAGSLVDAVEPRVRLLLAEHPRMPATVIAERIGWQHSLTILKDRVRELRPLFVGLDPADRVEYAPGEIAQNDLWFPPVPIPVGKGQERILPVLAMTSGYSRTTGGLMIPSRKAGDILAGQWALISDWGRCPRTLVWDREAAIGGSGKLTAEAAGFAGTLGVRIRLAPRKDPEFKGLVERRNGFFETSFLPGRVFTSPGDFNEQFTDWIATKANTRHLRSIAASPTERWTADKAAMVSLPPLTPTVGLMSHVRLARDYYVRIASNDYSVDPRAIGRFVDVIATPDLVAVTCNDQIVATHTRFWGTGATITDPEHVATAKALRSDFNALRARRAAQHGTRTHTDGHVVALRALPDYDALFGVDFHHPNTESNTESDNEFDTHDEGANSS
jgi:transcriptional regulator with XRE-family HTH domain